MLTSYGQTKLLQGLIGQTDSAPLPVCYVGLSTTTPNADGTNFTEPSPASGYARVLIGDHSAPASWAMAAPLNGTSSNSARIVFPIASAAWGTVTYMGFFDAETGGNLVAFYPLVPSMSVGIDVAPTFKLGDLTVYAPNDFAILSLNGNVLTLT